MSAVWRPRTVVHVSVDSDLPEAATSVVLRRGRRLELDAAVERSGFEGDRMAGEAAWIRSAKPRTAGILVVLVVLVVLAVGTATATAAAASGASPATLAHARTIRDEVNTRTALAAGTRLSVTEATFTDPLDSFTLLTQELLATRFVPAQAGVWYAICAKGALCPYPKPRLSRPAGDYLPRRLAFELAVRTFLETDAPVVGVALPTRTFAAIVLERAELEEQVDLAALAEDLRAAPLLRPPARVRDVLDELARPRTYLFLEVEPGPYGPLSWAGMPCWPTVDS